MKIILFVFALILSMPIITGRERENILQKEFAKPGVAESFKPGGEWFPYPAYADRTAWESIIYEADKKPLIERAEKALDYKWQAFTASSYLEYERSGDRSEMESYFYGNRRAIQALVVGELLEGKGRFIPQLINGLWFSCQQFSWVLSAHQNRQRSARSLPDDREHFIDHGSASYGAAVAIAYHFFHEEFDKVDPSISYTIRAAIRKHILDPYMDPMELEANRWLALAQNNTDGFVNNWTPWCNSDVMLAYLLVEEDDDRLRMAVHQSVRSVEEFLEYTTTDGACEEGPAYWSQAAGRLYDYLQIMYDASGGMFDLLKNDRIKESGEYICRAWIGDGYVVNFADASARNGINVNLVWSYAEAVGSAEMKSFAHYLMGNDKHGRFYVPHIPTDELYRGLHAIRNRRKMRDEVSRLNGSAEYYEAKSRLIKDIPVGTWYPQTELAYMRNNAEWFFAAKGGHNNESHNHNDIGTCVLFIRNIPVLVDAGVGVYKRQTFSHERYTLWPMNSPYHNLLSPNDGMQPHGKEYRSENCNCAIEKGTFSVQLNKAYSEEAALNSLVRSYKLFPAPTSVKPLVSRCGNFYVPSENMLGCHARPSLTITDAWSLSERKRSDVEHLLVKADVVLPGEIHDGYKVRQGELLLLCDKGLVVKVTYPSSLRASYERIELDDNRLKYAWGDMLTRVSLTSASDAPLKGIYKIVLTEFD